MKRAVVFLLVIAIIAFGAVGCSKGKSTNRQDKQVASQVQVEKDKEVKDMTAVDDKDLLALAADGDEQLNLSNDIDIDGELNDIEALLNDSDQLADIPASIELK